MSTIPDLAIAACADGAGWWLYRHELERRDDAASARVAAVKVADAAQTRAQRAAIATPAPASAHARPSGPTQPISRDYDPLFAAYGAGLPVAYLRALAAHESDMHTAANDGPAAGLLQVVSVVRDDYNQRHGTHFTRGDLLAPIVNVEIAGDAIRRIVESYRTNHPRVPNLQEDWHNPRFVELATFGWNAGFSERGGVGRVARLLESRGRIDLTIELVAASSREAGASEHLSNPRKVSYAKAVTATYFAELARDERELSPHSSTGAKPS
jgi:hypothetical protein